ncbi:MAG: tetratricopeptide repeat protein [Pseudomonadota bacterium]
MRWIALALLAGPAFAECPANPDIARAEGDLYARIQALPTGGGVGPLNAELWQLWTAAPDAEAQALLDAGMQALRFGDYGSAAERLDALIAYCPDYAEGYNQRGFVHYLQFQFAEALTMLEAAEARSPRHTGVLTGMALTLIGLGRTEEAQAPLRRALRLNPWLSERALLTEPLEPLGQEL